MKNPLPTPAIVAAIVIAVVIAGAVCFKAVSGSQTIEMTPGSAAKGLGGGKMGAVKKMAGEKPSDNGGTIGLAPPKN